MSLAPESTPAFALEAETLADPKTLLLVPVGLASPLWTLFAGAAVSGAAWWWMSRWAQPANLEAMFGAAARFEAEMEVEAVAQAEPGIEAVAEAEPILEAAAETVAEPVAEAAPEPILTALADEPASFAPVGGESAPISPLVEAMAPDAPQADAAAEAPKPRKRPAAPSAD